MPKVVYIDHQGTECAIDAKTGHSVMETAVKNGVIGIVGECGGNCACGTCRVYVDAAWRDVAGGQTEAERGMIEFWGETDPATRLSCQIRVTDRLDGLIVRIPESQY